MSLIAVLVERHLLLSLQRQLQILQSPLHRRPFIGKPLIRNSHHSPPKLVNIDISIMMSHGIIARFLFVQHKLTPNNHKKIRFGTNKRNIVTFL